MALSCERCVELFGDHVEDVLAPDRRAELEEHLRGCARCAEALSDYERVPALVRRATAARIPAAAGARLRRLMGHAWRRRGH
jgi:anti-sigma factor RsiW